MEILEKLWGFLLLYSVFAFCTAHTWPKPKTRKGAIIQLTLSGLMGWAWFLFVECPKQYLKNRGSK